VLLNGGTKCVGKLTGLPISMSAAHGEVLRMRQNGGRCACVMQLLCIAGRRARTSGAIRVYQDSAEEVRALDTQDSP
jgi:hypothetical protein